VNSDDVRRLEAVGSPVTFPAGHVLVERGQHGGGLFVIVDGTVVVEAAEGNLTYGAGSVIGERALLSPDGRRAARVRATTELHVLAIDRGAFDQLCAEDAAFAERAAGLSAR